MVFRDLGERIEQAEPGSPAELPEAGHDRVDGLDASGATVGTAPFPPSRRPSRKHRWWAVPLAAIGLGLPIAALVGNSIQVNHWAFAPGEASAVGSRLSFVALPAGVVEDNSPGKVLFVTVTGAHLNVLQYAIGGTDGDVRMLTKEQRFGKADPSQEHQIDLQMMRDAKQVAEYIAYRRLGFDAKLKAGAVVVEQMLCLNGETTQSDSCDKPAPAAEFLKRGSTITAIDGTPTPTVDELAAVMKTKEPGSTITVTYHGVHDDDEKTATFASMRAANEDGKGARAIVGFIAHDTYSVVLPFRATIDTDTGRDDESIATVRRCSPAITGESTSVVSDTGAKATVVPC